MIAIIVITSFQFNGQNVLWHDFKMIFKVFVDQVNQVCLLHFAVGCDSHRGFVVIVIP
jgi:hypothetical protein